VQDLPPSQPTQIPSTPAQPPQTASNEGIRLSIPLEKFLNQFTPTIQNDQVHTINVDLPRPAPESPAAGGRQPVAAAPQPRPETTHAPGLVETPARVESRELPKPATIVNKPPSIPGGKPYVVVEGDTLPAIAKKMYGPEEGNRMVNIERIFQANVGILKSPSLVVVGQKLIIPPLPKPATTTAPGPTSGARATTPAEVLSPALFEKPKTSSESMTISEKVDSLLKRAPATLPAPTPEGRWYTVQDGDNLWKIAASQLGAGSRWDEIHKLNTDLLPSQDSLKVGMRLRLPAK
jgi:nucleoid-associated protein YgaU